MEEHGLLSKEEFEFIISSSKQKNDKIMADSVQIYELLLNKTYESGAGTVKDFCEGAYQLILAKIDAKMEKVLEQELYKVGYTIKDTHFLANFKPIFPLIKKLYYDKKIKPLDIQFNYKSEAINQALRKEAGGYLDQFLIVLKEAADEHNKRLFVKNIKLMRDVRIKGIPLGVMKDTLSAFKRYEKKKNKSI
jgi:hypothetical protein